MLVRPRRFALVFQFDPGLHGTTDQQLAIRKALTPKFGSLHARALWCFARMYKRDKGRSYVTIEVKPMAGYSGLAGQVSIAINDALQPQWPHNVMTLMLHEWGHLWDNCDFITQADRAWFATQCPGRYWQPEFWASAVMEWAMTDGQSWPALTPILTREPYWREQT